MRIPHSLLLPLALPLAYADVLFTSPRAGEKVKVGTIDVRWKDSGNAPSLSQLTSYSLALLVGGNENEDMLQIASIVNGASFRNGNHASGTIPAGISGPATNGFFFKITSTYSGGGQVINFSDRFTIKGLDGVLAPKFGNAVSALDGDDSAPARQLEGVTGLPGATSASSSGTARQKATSSSNARQSKPAAPAEGPTSSTSSGAIAGIVVGVLIAVAAVIGLAAWLLLRRRRRRRSLPGSIEKKAEKHISTTTLTELGTDGRVIPMEMGDGMPPPMADSTPVSELEGSYWTDPVAAAESPIEGRRPFTPVTPSINGEETLDPTSTFKWI